METQEGLQNHLNAPSAQICDPHEVPASQDPEDGISAKIEDVLNGRRANTKVDSWKILWQTLFPDDKPEDIRDERFVPPVECDEVYSLFQDQCWQDALKQRVSEEERNAADSDEDLEAHIARVVDIVGEHIDRVFHACRGLKIDNNLIPKRKRRVAGAQKQNVSPSLPEHSQSTLASSGQNLGLRIAISNGSSPHSSPHDTGSTNGSYLGSQQTVSQVEDMMTTPTASSSQQFEFSPPYPGLGLATNGIVGPLPSRPYASSPIDKLPYQEEAHHNRIPSSDSGVSFDATAFSNGNMYQQPQVYGQQTQPPFQGGGFNGPLMGPDFAMQGPMTTMAGSSAMPGQVLPYTHHNGFGYGPPQQGYNNGNDHVG